MSINSSIPQEITHHQFIISRLSIYLEVTCYNGKAWLTLLQSAGRESAVKRIVTSEQLLLQIYLRFTRPEDTTASVKEYFKQKGWKIEEVVEK